MKIVTFRWLFGVCLGFSLMINLNAQDVATIKVLNVIGDVQSDGRKLLDGNKLKEGATIKSADKSSCVLLFSNGSRIDVAEKTTLKVAQFTQEAYQASLGEYDKLKKDPSKSETKIDLQRGKLLFKVKELSAVSKYSLGTPIGVAGIRGTEGSVTINASDLRNIFKSLITLSEGNVQFTYSDPSRPESTITAGLTLDVSGTYQNGIFTITNLTVRPATTQELQNARVGTAVARPTPSTRPPVAQADAQRRPESTTEQTAEAEAAAAAVVAALSDYERYRAPGSLLGFNTSIPQFEGTVTCTFIPGSDPPSFACSVGP